jgi:hypothetical protein
LIRQSVENRRLLWSRHNFAGIEENIGRLDSLSQMIEFRKVQLTQLRDIQNHSVRRKLFGGGLRPVRTGVPNTFLTDWGPAR